MQKNTIEEYVKLCKEIEEAIRGNEKEVDGVIGGTAEVGLFHDMCTEMQFVDVDKTDEGLTDAMYQLMSWSGRWFLYGKEPVKVVEIDGERCVFVEKGVFEDTYGETDIERTLTSLALFQMEYPISDRIRDHAEGLGISEEYVDNVDDATVEQFGIDAVSLDRRKLPDILLDKVVLLISMDGCGPCKVVEKALSSMSDVNYHVVKNGDLGYLEEELNVFCAPVVIFSDGDRLLYNFGAVGSVGEQKEFIRSVLEALDTAVYNPYIGLGQLEIHGEKSYLRMAVIR